MTADLVAFLRARYDEENAEAEKLADIDDYSLDSWEITREETGEWNSYAYLRIAKKRALAEIEAKQRLVRDYEDAVRSLAASEPNTPAHDLMTGAVSTLARTLRLLVLPYADHPDYRDEWRP